MIQQDRARIGEQWYALAQMYGREIPRAALTMMLNSIDDLDADSIISALEKWVKISKQNRHPMPAEIRELVCPEENISIEAQAREISARICGAIPKFGWCNSKDAREHIGPAGWLVVERQGGWNYLCQNMGVNINPTSFQAQIRDQVAANIQYGSAALEEKIKALPSSTGLMQIGEIMKLAPAKTVDKDPNLDQE